MEVIPQAQRPCAHLVCRTCHMLCYPQRSLLSSTSRCPCLLMAALLSYACFWWYFYFLSNCCDFSLFWCWSLTRSHSDLPLFFLFLSSLFIYPFIRVSVLPYFYNYLQSHRVHTLNKSGLLRYPFWILWFPIAFHYRQLFGSSFFVTLVTTRKFFSEKAKFNAVSISLFHKVLDFLNLLKTPSGRILS